MALLPELRAAHAAAHKRLPPGVSRRRCFRRLGDAVEQRWSRWALRPRVLREDGEVSKGQHLIGRPTLAAAGRIHRLLHSDAEVANAAGAYAADAKFVVPGHGPLRDIAATGVTCWMQVYPLHDRRLTWHLVERALGCGAQALVLTSVSHTAATRIRVSDSNLSARPTRGLFSETMRVMANKTPRSVVASVVRSVCGRDFERLVRLSGGGMNETYRADLDVDVSVIVRIARQQVPWFADEAYVSAQAREVGVPAPEVLGVEWLVHDDELLSFSIHRFIPGRSLAELVEELGRTDLESLVVEAGEFLARAHSIPPSRGIKHVLRPPQDRNLARALRTVRDVVGRAAETVIERGANFVREQATAGVAPALSLAQGDFLPKNLLVDDGVIVGVIDWEFAGPAPPAVDLARWQVSAGDPLHDRSDWLRRGYARVTDPASADAGLVPAFAIDWALELLGWRDPDSPAQIQRCVEVIARYVAA